MTATGLRLLPQDEFPHPPDAAENFNESVYANCFDPRLRMGAWMRLGNRVNEGYAELSVCLYLPDGRVACQFQRPADRGQRPFEAGGLRYAVERARSRRWRWSTRASCCSTTPRTCATRRAMFKTAPRVDGAVQFDIRGVSAVHGGEPTAPEHEQLMYYGPQFSRGHFNQHTGGAARSASAASSSRSTPTAGATTPGGRATGR